VNEIRKDISEGQKAGVRGTPTFFVGVLEREDTKIKVLFNSLLTEMIPCPTPA